VAGLVMWLLPVAYHGLTPWRLVYILPGASAIRAIGRIEVLVGSMFALGLVILITQWWRTPGRSTVARTFVVLLMLLVCLEQMNLKAGQVTPREKVAALESVVMPPEECESFVLVPPFDPDHPWYETSIDAIDIARRTGVPTWNGYSGDWPDGWTLMTDRPDYMEQVKAWQDSHSISSACGYRMADGTWLTPGVLERAVEASSGSPQSRVMSPKSG
jgi:hypothetical protein